MEISLLVAVDYGKWGVDEFWLDTFIRFGIFIRILNEAPFFVSAISGPFRISSLSEAVAMLADLTAFHEAVPSRRW